MLQRQIMFKQLQEMQRRHQLQELVGSSGATRDSRMLMFDNMQMLQQGESSIFQGSPSGLVSQGQSNLIGPMGMSSPQFDMSLYGNHAPNPDKNLNQYSYPQDPSNFSANLSTKNHDSPLGMSPVDISSVARSFMSQQGNFSADQNATSDGSLLSSQVFQEKNLLGEVPFYNTDSNLVSLSYSPQGITTQRTTSEGRLDDTCWPGNSPGEVSKVYMSEASATLDPLEQKILYSSDDHGWSALMQSAVTETSSSGTGVQEEWSGLSFQNLEPSSDNPPLNLSTGEKLQDNWVNRNLQRVSSPNSEPNQFPRPNMDCSFPSSQNSGKQFLIQKDDFQCESSHVSDQCSPRIVSQLTDFNFQLKHPTGGDQLVQTSLLSENTLNAQYNENSKNDHGLKDTLWHSNPASGGFQMPFGQLNQPNFHRYSVESDKTGPGDNVDPSSAHLGASDVYGQNVAAQSTVPNSEEFGFRPGLADSRTPQSYSLSPSLPMHVGFPTGLPPLGPNVTSQKDVPSPRANKFSSSSFQTPGSASRSLETNPRAPEQASLNSSKHEHNIGYHELNPTLLNSNIDSQQSFGKHYSEVDGVAPGSYMGHTSPQPSDQVEQKDVVNPAFSVSDSIAYSHHLDQNHSLLHQVHQSRDGQTVSAMRFPFNYQQETANTRELLLSGQNVQIAAFSPGNDTGNFLKEVHDQPAKASSTGYLQALQTTNPKAPTTAMPSISESSTGNIPENRLSMQVGSANTAQGSGIFPSSAASLIASKHLSPLSMLSSDVTCQNLAISNLKKRKIVAYDLEPWHKELNSEAMRPQNISTADFQWAQALGRRQEEAINEAAVVVDVHPVVRAKRRLIITTQLMQHVFRPLVATILIGDASSNCVAYSTARTTLGDACNLNNKMLSDGNDESPDKLETLKRTTRCDFSEIVKCLISRAEKLEGDLSRLDQRLSVVDIKVESQELEKFSMLNRFAKFHFKVHSSKVDPASSSGQSTVQKTKPQRYVTAAPMPKILPEDGGCISL